ncbi:hypothetical protein P3T23_004504 [Paraburkholderia sp. GAS448]|uniref:PD-(D/E)XK nuclease family protein n=1 Tax=Paraburkholderia sp. GAS448 TaxID=3035136 RepID=UPI003D1CCEEC
MNRQFIPISQTALSTFQNCPRQFEARYVTKEVRFEETDAIREGNRLHKSLELRIRDGRSMPAEFAHLEWVGRLLDGYRGKAEIHVERRLAVDHDFHPCEWEAQDTKYVYGKDDCTVVMGERAVTLDWKSGRLKHDTQQLQMLALLTFAHHPKVQTVDSALVFFKADDMVRFRARRGTFTPEGLFDEFRRYEATQAEGKYPPTPCGLCKAHCPVTRCEYHGRGG